MTPYYGNYNYMQPSYTQQYLQQPQRPQPVSDDRIWVTGEAGAKGYIVAPGCTVTLWDSEAPVIWLKGANAQGIPALQRLTYQYADLAPATPGPDFEGRLAKIEERIKQLETKGESDHD